jgi:hypothetical protein
MTPMAYKEGEDRHISGRPRAAWIGRPGLCRAVRRSAHDRVANEYHAFVSIMLYMA